MTISILLIAVVGPMSIIARSLPQSAYARDHAIAVNLAQEGIEAVRQKRDSNMLADWNGPPDVAWDSGIEPMGYIVDPGSLAMLNNCGGAGCGNPDHLVVRQSPAGLYYQTDIANSDPKTKFQRLVVISSGSELHEKYIISMVYWGDAIGNNYSIIAKESISGINS